MRSSSILFTTAVLGIVFAKYPAAINFHAGEWLGNDGNWSTVDFQVGSNKQPVNVLVANTLSEFWVPGPDACDNGEPQCQSARGGLFYPNEGTDWSSIGTWSLALDYLNYDANGYYGTDDVRTAGTESGPAFKMGEVLTAVVNSTDVFLGMFGLNFISGNFGDDVEPSPLTRAIKTYGLIPSYTYGYTAGAHYKNSPVSVTAGGYDAARFNDHDTDYTLTQADGIPRALIRGISATASSSQTKPDNFTSKTQTLSTWDSAFTVMIDSATPFMWLPDDICEEFADSLGLTYNDTLDVYTLTDEQYTTFKGDDALSFTFSLSSIDNKDTFGSPLEADGVINITISSQALVSTLEYPYGDGALKYGDAAVPYFSLRKSSSSSNNATMVLGRSVLQEMYLVTKYDYGTFSLHQAIFTDDSNVIAVAQPNGSPYPPPASHGSNGLSTGAIVGIVIAVVAVILFISFLAFWYFRRRQRAQKQAESALKEKASDSSLSSANHTPRSPIMNFFARMIGRRRSTGAVEADGLETNPVTEAPNTEIYELPVPIHPVELNGDDSDAASITGETELVQNMSQDGVTSYENARRRLDTQLRGPVPAYAPPPNGVLPPPEKAPSDMNISPLDSPQQITHPSPVSSQTHSGDENSNSNLPSLPSPLSPRDDVSGRWPSSNRTGTGSSPLARSAVTSTNDSNSTQSKPRAQAEGEAFSRTGSSESVSPTSSEAAQSIRVPTTAAVQRTLIDPSKIVFLGRLPSNISFPSPTSPSPPSEPREGTQNNLAPSAGAEGSLGSNFTEQEDERIAQTLQRVVQSRAEGGKEGSVEGRRERVDPGRDLVHVPQMADRRYSWEDER